MKSRILKFRAYDTIDNKWLFGYEYEKLGGFNLVGEVTLFGQLNTINLERWNDVHIMQFTGLKDKNGKDIYEGDIVKVNHPVYDPDSSIDSVNFIDGCWRVTSNNKSDIPLFNYKPQSIEVIGNIYSNPELI